MQIWNQTAETLYGWSEREAIGRSILDLFPTVASQAYALGLMDALKQRQTWTGEFQVRHRQGREFTVFVTNSPILDDLSHIIGFIGVSADISTQKETQSKLHQHHEQALTLTRVVDAIHQSLDLDTIFSVSAAYIAQLLQAEVSIVQYVPHRQLWVHRTVFNAHQEPIAKVNEEIPDANNPIAERLKRLEVVQISDTRSLDDPINSRLAEIDPGSWLLTPISINRRVWGSLTLGRLHHYASWSEADIDLAQRVAAQLAIAIDQAETYGQLQQELAQRRANEVRLRQYERIVSATQDGIALLDRNYIYRVVNQVYLDWNQKSRDDIIGHSVADLLGEESFLHQVKPNLDRCLAGTVIHYEDWFTFPQRGRRYISLTYAPYSDQEGQTTGVVATSRDLTELKLAQYALQEQESFFRSLYEQATLGIAFCRADGSIVQANGKFCAITGYREADLQSMALGQLIHPGDRLNHHDVFREVARGQRSGLSTDQRYQRQDGTFVWVSMTTSVIRDDQGHCQVLAVIIQDISHRKHLEAEQHRAEAQLRHNALHDALTQLPNRNLLMAHLERALKRQQRPPHTPFAVMFLDIDRFKLVNDSLGHLVGDQLLITIAETLSQLVRPGDLVARLGGDEFVILLDVVEDLSDVLAVADRILYTLRQPFAIEQREVYATASMGIVMGSKAYTSATELLRDADIAMYRAKANGKNGYALFDPTLHDRVMARLQIEHDLRRALDQQQLALFYQPIVSLRDGSIAYIEALMRWYHPDRGMISPGEFIPIAEETGLIVALDRWALITACRQLRQWQQRFPLARELRVSVNLSAQDLHAPDLIGDIRTALTQSGLEGCFLVIEMTESLLISDTQPVIQLIAQLQDLSVQLSVDDFGTGYSSLSYLHRFPLNALKIDQSFTSNMRQGPVNREIIETIVALSDRLGMAAIAEGGETLEQIAHLKQIGCEYSQGYHFCKPLPAAELEALLQRSYPFADRLPP